MFGMGIGEVLLLGMIAVLLFGKRLPEVAHTLGQHYHKFRQGLTDIQYEMTRASNVVDRTLSDTRSHIRSYVDEDYEQPTAPQFSLPADESVGGAFRDRSAGQPAVRSRGRSGGTSSSVRRRIVFARISPYVDPCYSFTSPGCSV